MTLRTTCRTRTPLAPCAALWGELLLGDLERNILGVTEDRAEAAAG